MSYQKLWEVCVRAKGSLPHVLTLVSSYHAFSWNFTTTLQSYAFLSAWGIQRPFPRNISNGLTRGTPSTKIVNCTIHCRFSKPDAPLQYHTVEVPDTSYLSPPLNVNGSGVWSTCLCVILDKFWLQLFWTCHLVEKFVMMESELIELAQLRNSRIKDHHVYRICSK